MRTAPYKADPLTSSSLVPEDPSTDYITIWRHQGHQTLREREGFRVSAGLIDKRCATIHTQPQQREMVSGLDFVLIQTKGREMGP